MSALNIAKQMGLACLLLTGAACSRQLEPESKPEGIDTLIFVYQQPAERQELQAWFEQQGLELEMKQNAGGKSEYSLSLSEAQFAQYQPQLGSRYRLQRQGQRLYLVCCQP